MKDKTWIIKGLLGLLVGILLGLLVWMILDQIGSQGEDTVQTTEILQREEAETEAVILPATSAAPESEPETEMLTEFQTEGIQLLFAGDVLLSDHVLKAYEKAGNIQGVVDQSLLDRISSSDIFMVNQEFPFSGRGQAAADKQYTFRLPPERVNLMQEMGIDMVTLANNHALDFGRDALLDTGLALEQAGIRYVGAGENLDRAKQLQTMEVSGKTIGFLAASRVIPETSWNAGPTTPGMLTAYDSAILVEQIRAARETSDYVIVYLHWGIEREDRPQDYQRVLGQRCIEAGADMVIGSHPHVLQGIEYYQGKPIVYSLGNFVFGSSIPKTMLLKAELKPEGVTLSLIPGTSSAGYTRELTEESKIQEFYQYIEGISFGIQIDDHGVVSEIAEQP